MGTNPGKIGHLQQKLGAGLLSLAAVVVAGCASQGSSAPPTPAATPSYAQMAGNWSFRVTGTTPQPVTSLGGSLSVQGTEVSGMLHLLAGTCQSSAGTGAILITGSVDSHGLLTLRANDLAGGTLRITGMVAADQRSLLAPALAVTGGACGAVSASQAVGAQPLDGTAGGGVVAQQQQPVNGTYTGSFAGVDGVVAQVSAVLTQSATPDANGMYHLSGNASFAGSPCLNAPVVTDSVINGNSIAVTYTDPQTGSSVTGTGVFDNTATTLTVSGWTLSGTCGTDHGTGMLARQ